MVNYKLTYFNGIGLAEPIRLLLHQSGIKFEDKRLDSEEWPKVKSSTPYGQAPVLEIDGKQFAQSKAIARYVARKNNLYGANEEESYEIDATIDLLEDLRLAGGRWNYEQNAEQKEKFKAAFDEKLLFTLQKLDEQIKKNGGFLVNGKLSWADLQLVAQVDSLHFVLKSEPEKDFPEVKNLVAKVKALPKIKAYLDNRPQGLF